MNQIKTEEGIKGFFRGSSLSMIKTSIGFASFFTNLENFNKINNIKDNKEKNFIFY